MKINKEADYIEQLAAQLMTAARTAPKGKGLDNLNTGLMEAADKELILKEMAKLFEETGRELFQRDAKNLEDADACVLFGIKGGNIGLDCGGCGMACKEMEKARHTMNDQYSGPNCAFKLMDLGIALGSAGRTAMDLCLDNRMMYSVGLAAKRAGLIEGDIVIAMPLSVKGKNIFFDRKK